MAPISQIKFLIMPKAMALSAKTLAVVVPCFEDYNCLPYLISELSKITSDCGDGPCRIILLVVNDSPWIIPGEQPASPSGISILNLQLPFNVGHQKALSHGIDWIVNNQPDFDYLITMDIDGEDDPHKIPHLISTLKIKHKIGVNASQIAVAKRGDRCEGKRFSMNYRLYKILTVLLTGEKIDFGNFIVFSRLAASIIAKTPEISTHLAASVVKSRIPITKVRINRRSRYTGFSKMGGYNGLIMHAFRAFSVLSDRISIRLLRLNFAFTIISAGTMLAAISLRFLFSDYFEVFPGWTSLVFLIVISFFSLATLIVFSLCILVARQSSSHRLSFSTSECRIYWQDEN